jgi:RimJ/RimL family protein N-acetyltransferase
MIITGDRVVLRPWREADLESFVPLHADPEVMVDASTIKTRAQSEAKFQRYIDAFKSLGFCRWAMEHRDGNFLGYVGIMPIRDRHPLAPSVEIGWRLVRRAWGKGYATEGARATLTDGLVASALPRW